MAAIELGPGKISPENRVRKYFPSTIFFPPPSPWFHLSNDAVNGIVNASIVVTRSAPRERAHIRETTQTCGIE